MEKSRFFLEENAVPSNCVAINTDVRLFDWSVREAIEKSTLQKFGQVQKRLAGRLFDVVMIDPPWQLTSDNPSRGVEVTRMDEGQVAIKYQTLSDEAISAIPLHKIQSDGLLFMWVINCKFTTAIKMIELWGYKWEMRRDG